MRKSIFVLIILVSISLFKVVNAQASSELNFSLYPINPGPNQFVTVSIENYSTDLNSANIKWSVNGSTYKSGYGVTSISLNTGALGSTKNVSVAVFTKEGAVIQGSLSIVATSVDLIWESESYTPPFYKGKAMYSHENKINVIAIPHLISGGKEIPVKNLVYKWTNNGEVLQSASGYGKNVLTLTGSLISRPLNLEVEVSSPTSNVYSYTRTVIEPKTPEIIVYEKDPIYGIRFERAISGAFDLRGREVTLVALPLFFSAFTPNPAALEYKWTINGAPANTDPWEYTQTFRTENDQFGKASVGVNINNKTRILQSASNKFDIIFNKPTPTDSF